MEQTIPSKLFDYLLAARPILAGLAGEGQQILRSTGANVIFAPGDVAGLKSALLEAVRNFSSLNLQRREQSSLSPGAFHA